MLIEHQGKSPCIDEDAWVAPDATLCGDVTVGPGSRIMHGARLIAEGGSIAVGRSSIVMQNAFDPAQTLRMIDDHAITNLHLVPTQFVRLFRELFDVGGGDRLDHRGVGSRCVVAGERPRRRDEVGERVGRAHGPER